MRRIFATMIVIAGPVFGAVAGPVCTTEPKEKWLSEAAITSKIAALGFKFKSVKITSGKCYEIYGRDKNGKRVEVYFNPVTGEIVEQHKS